MRTLFSLLCLCAISLPAAGAELLNISFQAPGQTSTRKVESPVGAFSGVLPRGWLEDFTHWSKSSGSGQFESTDGGFFRFKTLHVESGHPQIFMPSPELKSGENYRFVVTYRNRSTGAFSLWLRMIPDPFKKIWSMDLPPSPDWTTKTVNFRLTEKSPVPVGIFLVFPEEGEFDLKSIVLQSVAAEDLTEKVLLSTRFYENTLPVEVRSADTQSSFSGVLPSGWRENYVNWMKNTNATAREVNSGPYRFLEIVATSGAPQLIAPAPGVRGKQNYRLTIYGRNLTGAPVKFSLRNQDKPYQTAAEAYWPPSTSWEQTVLPLKVSGEVDYPAALLLNYAAPGKLEIADIKLETAVDGGVSPIRRPLASSRNFFRNSRLPLGLQSGWNVERYEGYYGTAEADKSVIGPSGAAALKLTSWPHKNIGIFSEPFNVADPKSPNTVSFFYRGKGIFSTGIMSQDATLGRLQLQPTAEWQRAVFQFETPENRESFALRISGNGNLWVDGFRVNSGTDGNYVSAGDCEVALALPPSELADSRMQFRDEAPQIQYHLSGDVKAAKLVFTITDLYGKTRPMAKINVDERTRSGIVTLPLEKNRELGQFRVEVQAFRNDQAVSPVNELVVTRIDRPVFGSSDAPESPFGVHVLPYPPILKSLKAAGVNWARLHDAGTEYTGWYYLEPQKGQWQFDDRAIQTYRDHHFMLFGQLGTAPRWASYLAKVDTGRKQDSYHDRYFQVRPEHMGDFANYVKTVVGRYKGVIDQFFIWNEPWVPGWWGVDFDKNRWENQGYITSKNPQRDFAALSKVAFEAAKSANPAVVIAGFNTIPGLGWTEGVYDAGGLAYCDAVDFHYYTDRLTGFDKDITQASLEASIGYIQKKENNKLNKPIFMSEGQGASSGSFDPNNKVRYAGMYKHAVPWNNRENYHSIADRNVRYIVSLLANRVDRIYLYSAHAYNTFANSPEFLVLLGADGYPHPMLPAHSAMACRLEGKRFVEMKSLGDGGLVAYIFSDGKKSTAVISGKLSDSGSCVSTQLPGAKAADLYGNELPIPFEFTGAVCYVTADISADHLAKSIILTQGGHQK